MFKNTLYQHLLPRIIEKGEEILPLTSGQDESRWNDPSLDIALRQCLQTRVERSPSASYQSSYDEFRARLRAIVYTLSALEIEFRSARSFLHDEAGPYGEVR
jgi:hypothetical protein